VFRKQGYNVTLLDPGHKNPGLGLISRDPLGGSIHADGKASPRAA
jgi:hypothetical protein